MSRSSFLPNDLHNTEQQDDIPSGCFSMHDTEEALAAAEASSPHTIFSARAMQMCKEAIFPYLGTRLIVICIGLLATYYILPLLVSNARLPTFAVQGAFPQSLWLMWNRFDSGFYVDIAQHGYWPASTLHTRSDWVFYPLYPLLISLLGRLMGASPAAFNIAGVVIANGAGVVMVGYLYALVSREYNTKIASRTVLYLAIFPLAFFFSAIYTESLLLCLSIASIYYARQQSWWLAGLCGGLAALTRLQGVTLIVPLTWEYLRVVSARYAPPPDDLPSNLTERVTLWCCFWGYGLYLAARRVKNWLAALPLVLVPCGLLAFMLYAYFAIGDFFATFHTSRWGWGRQMSSPWHLLAYSFLHPVLGQPLNWNFWLLNIVSACAFLAGVLWSLRRLPMIYTLYAAVTILLPLSSSSINSLARYCLLVFPAFLLLALLTCKGEKQHLHAFIVAGFAALQSFLLVLFVLGIFAIA